MRRPHGFPSNRPMPWRGGRSPVRMVLAVLAILVGVPLGAGVLLTAMFAGWTSVAVAVVFWVALLTLGFVGIRLAFRNIRPVQEMTSAASRLAQGDYTARVAATDSRALSSAVDSFNQMAERLEISDDLRRRLLADVGHELRTPLTIIRGEIEAMADGVREISIERLRPLLDDVDAMEHLLDDLRTLSTTEAGMVDLDLQPTDVGELVDEVVGRFASRSENEGVDLVSKVGLLPGALVDPDRIIQVLMNVTANAFKATSEGDRIEIRGHEAADGETIVIEVADTGRGIQPERVESVFDRFHKDPDSSGSGLGLTISRDLVVAHGGSIELTSEVGIGTTVTIHVPVASPSQPANT